MGCPVMGQFAWGSRDARGSRIRDWLSCEGVVDILSQRDIPTPFTHHSPYGDHVIDYLLFSPGMQVGARTMGFSKKCDYRYRGRCTIRSLSTLCSSHSTESSCPQKENTQTAGQDKMAGA